MSRPTSSRKNQSQSFFSGENTLRIIGFIADMTAIITVIFAIKTDAIARFLPFMMSPWVLLPIWIIAAYTYICWLHYYWLNSTQEHNWAVNFGGFFIGELILRLKKPVVLFPLLLLAITLVWILQASGLLVIAAQGVMIVMVAAVMIFLFGAMVTDGELAVWISEKFISPANESQQSQVEEKWEEFVTFLESKIDGFQWITLDEFRPIMKVWKFNETILSHAIAKYCAKNPTVVHLGKVYRKSGYRVTDNDVLINLECLDTQKYYYK